MAIWNDNELPKGGFTANLGKQTNKTTLVAGAVEIKPALSPWPSLSLEPSYTLNRHLSMKALHL
jgi:hypothetical protein